MLNFILFKLSRILPDSPIKLPSFTKIKFVLFATKFQKNDAGSFLKSIVTGSVKILFFSCETAEV